jgi:hypothetical protein
MEDLERQIFICDCASLEHQLSIWYDKDDSLLYLEPRLHTHKNFFKRVVAGVKYIFGHKSRYGSFDEILLNKESQLELLTNLKSLNLENDIPLEEDEVLSILKSHGVFPNMENSLTEKDIRECSSSIVKALGIKVNKKNANYKVPIRDKVFKNSKT